MKCRNCNHNIIDKTRVVYCSNKCYEEYRRKVQRKEKPEICSNCGHIIKNQKQSGYGRFKIYCKREKCVKERKNRKMREIYYTKTNRPELVLYVRNH